MGNLDFKVKFECVESQGIKEKGNDDVSPENVGIYGKENVNRNDE